MCDRSDCNPSTCASSSHRAKPKAARRTRLDIILDEITAGPLPVGLRPGDVVGPRTAPSGDLFKCGNDPRYARRVR